MGRETQEPMIDRTPSFTVRMLPAPVVYRGTDEGLADAKYDELVSYIDNDVCHEPHRAEYLIDGEVVASHDSITWKRWIETGRF